MASNAELQAEVDRLNAEADELAAENERLTADNERLNAEVASAEDKAQPESTGRREPQEPSFKLSEGNRAELEDRGHTISPFTGVRLVGTGVEDAREVSAEEYERVAKEAAKREAGDPSKGTTFPKADEAE